ncbi:MAG TPA: tRNA pseudouridine(13) synthase TruD [Candidatus Nanoarchaeia archaeon]|nr:tRNA pseudouridine(13) synthase TruD [Candidatus Nanoarchaeia archaeon]
MYTLKQQPEDFQVREITHLMPHEEGSHALFWMTKKFLNTEDALQKICYTLKIPRKYLGVAGNKDRTAVTQQLISVPSALKERLEKLQLTNTRFEFYGYSDGPISLGDLLGNQFKIIIRNLNPWEKPKALSKIVNAFGEQRFSTHNSEIGKELIQKKFKQAVFLIQESKSLLNDKIVLYLKKHRQDFVGSLRLIPKKLLKLYVHSYQAKLFNELAQYCLEHKICAETLPLIGFATEFKGKIGELAQKKLKDEKITTRDFIIREIPELSSEGTSRELHVELSDLYLHPMENDELNLHKKKVVVEFRLPKGSYATEAVRQMMN